MYDYIAPRSKYYGDFTPGKLAFNANLQEFSAAVGFIVALETNGKIDSQEAYRRIRKQWRRLKRSKEALLTEG